MKRRQALSIVSGVGLAAVAGCLDRSGSPGSGSTDEPNDDGTKGPVIAERSFEVTGAGPGNKAQSADVGFNDTVSVTGTITGNNGCYTAKLADASIKGGKLAVTVKAVEDEDKDMCTQSIVDIEYEASFQFQGKLPEGVVVKHDSMGEVKTVSEKQR